MSEAGAFVESLRQLRHALPRQRIILIWDSSALTRPAGCADTSRGLDSGSVEELRAHAPELSPARGSAGLPGDVELCAKSRIAKNRIVELSTAHHQKASRGQGDRGRGGGNMLEHAGLAENVTAA